MTEKNRGRKKPQIEIDAKKDEPATSAQLYTLDAESLSELARLESEDKGAKAVFRKHFRAELLAMIERYTEEKAAKRREEIEKWK